MKYTVILKSLSNPTQWIILAEETTKANAEEMRKRWRKTLGGKAWTVDRRPGLDTLDNLALTVEVIA